MKLKMVLGIFLACVVPYPAFAQSGDGETSSIVTSRICEIHVWLQPTYIAKTFSIIPKLDNTFNSKNLSDEEFLQSHISIEFLRNFLRDNEHFSNESGEFSITVEDGIQDIKKLKSSKRPTIENNSECYIELFVVNVIYGKDSIWGGAIGLTAQRRKFADGVEKSSFRKVFGAAKASMTPSSYLDEAKLAADLQRAIPDAVTSLLKEAVE